MNKRNGLRAGQHVPILGRPQGGGSFFSGTDGAADAIALGSMVVSVISLRLSWQAARHVKVWVEAAVQVGDKRWLTAVVRNPGGAAVWISGWGVLAGPHMLSGYKVLEATETGSPSLNAPDKLPCELLPGRDLRLSWETAKVIQEYQKTSSGDPAWILVFIRVGWKERKIKSRLPRTWPKT